MRRIRSSRSSGARSPEELLALARRRGTQIRRRRRGLAAAAGSVMAGGLAAALTLTVPGHTRTTVNVISPPTSTRPAQTTPTTGQGSNSTVPTSSTSAVPSTTAIPGRSTPTAQPGYAYVTDNADGGVLVPVNLATGKTGQAIQLGGTPVGVAITADGKTAYVAVSTTPPGSSAVVPVDLATGAKGQPISVPGIQATSIVITPDGRFAYLTAWHRVQIFPVDLTARTTQTPISTPNAQLITAIAMAPDGRTAYVATSNGSGTNYVLPLHIPSNSLGPAIATLTASNGFSAMAVSPDGHYVYAEMGSRGMLPINLETGQTATVISQPDTADSGNTAVSADNKMVYSLAQPSLGCALIPFDLATNQAEQPITVAGTNNYCYFLAPSSDGTTIYITDTIAGSATTPNTGKLYAIDAATRTTNWVLPLPAGIQTGPGMLAVSP